VPNRFLELEKTLVAKRAAPRPLTLSSSFGRWTFARSASLPAGTIARTKRLEGSIEHMYLDTRGNVTVGVGRMLPTADAAAKLAFVRNSDGKPASAQEIKDEFALVKSKEKAKSASWYKQFTALHLTETTIDALLTENLDGVEKGLKDLFPAYDAYPEAAREALIDMAFNLGLTGLKEKFPKFVGHVTNKEWASAAAQSKRGGISDGRNEEIRKLLLDAAGAAP
jgi:GH24 family phage-related lysozyme (muramidase)